MITDPFSDILKLAEAQPTVVGGFTAGGDWALRFPAPDKLKFFCVVKGDCLMILESKNEPPIRISEGDVLLLSQGPSFILGSGADVKPIEAVELFAGKSDKTAIIGDREDCVQIGGHIKLNPTTGHFLTEVLPTLIHIKSATSKATTLRWLLDQLIYETKSGQPGASLATAQIAHLMFVQVLRVYLETEEQLPTGWLKAVSDRKLAPALILMHSAPEHPWRLEELAKESAMSRTTFAVHFKKVVGVGPLAYLAQWRMRLAEKMLCDDDTPISLMAEKLGYASESAFSNAFKRITGVSPQRYKLSQKSADSKEK